MPKWCFACAALLALLAGLPSAGRAQVESAAQRSEALVTQVDAEQPTAPAAVALLEALGFAGGFPSEAGGDAVESGLLGTQAPGNTAVIEQLGTGNTARVTQLGRRNMSAVYQEGSANWIDAAQLGNSNVFGAWLVGSDNRLKVTQEGNDNHYLLGFRGNTLRHEVVQEGNGNSLVQYGTGDQPFSVHQLGDGVEVRIEHNPTVLR